MSVSVEGNPEIDTNEPKFSAETEPKIPAKIWNVGGISIFQLDRKLSRERYFQTNKNMGQTQSKPV